MIARLMKSTHPNNPRPTRMPPPLGLLRPFLRKGRSGGFGSDISAVSLHRTQKPVEIIQRQSPSNTKVRPIAISIGDGVAGVDPIYASMPS